MPKTDPRLLVVPTLAFALSSCAPLVIAGAVSGGVVASQQRPIGRAFTDMAIQTDIETRLATSSFKLFRHVDVRVVESRVLLAGRVKNEDLRVQAGKVAWAVPNVHEVNNELIVGSKGGVARDLNDFRISNQMRAKLLADNKISSINYSLETIDGNMYVIGIARDEPELERVTLHARTIPGVKKVVSYVRLKDDPTRSEL